MSAVPDFAALLTDDRTIWDNWLAAYRLPVITVADEVGTFTALIEAAHETDTLAARLGVDTRALSIHLGLLAATGFVERREGRWRATPVTRTYLNPADPAYWGPLLWGYRASQPLHGQLMDTLKSGDKAEGHASAVQEWERGEMPADLAVQIAAFMNSHSVWSSAAAARQPLFSSVRSLLDVGGGSGIFSIALAKAWPDLRATVMEIPAMCAAAQPYADSAGLGGRVVTQAVDMFREDWPTGHDAHFLSNIFHDWSDTTCRLLAAKSFAALPPGGRIILHEMLMDDDGCGPAATAAFSILMLLGTRGRQYSLPELRGFMEEAGFTSVEAQQTGGGYYALVTAVKPA
jgi:acetylserotonin N-methyltransferase